MSTTFEIFEYPAPRTYTESELIVDWLRDHGPSGNPRFHELIRRLTAVHPCITTIPEDEQEERGVWIDGPLGGESDRGVYVLGIQTQRLTDVFPFVCDTANEIGLNVHSDGFVYRADGMVLDIRDDNGHERVSSTGIDLTRLTDQLAAQFEPLARPHGFRKIGFYLVRGIEGGWQCFLPVVHEHSDGRIVVDVNIQTYRYDVMRLVHKLDPERHCGNAHGRAFALSAYEFHKAPIVMNGPGDFLGVIRTLTPYVVKNLLPGADECATIEGLDSVMNTGRTMFRHYPLNHLVVSRLADSRAYDTLYDLLIEQGHVPDEMMVFFQVARQSLAHRVSSKHETVVHVSFGPGGGKSGVIHPEK
ncbi:hypothetical protein [Usitatibacter palustris]|uniref:Uncharacterized protein n=1 Tax=Usitatibacter palustris TaxID=2732487 RepID=A0A6M4H950_9PROT|nr:hypothetical protein [Usitatibacter palustris]QJR14557.1 hypothetical protein DSM104440_01358 [Usitatibacter palustris]